MPRVFEWRGYRFHYYSDEGDPREPVHIHVRKDGCDAKFWLRPFVTLAFNRGFSGTVLKRIAEQVLAHRDEIEAHWNDYFAGDD